MRFPALISTKIPDAPSRSKFLSDLFQILILQQLHQAELCSSKEERRGF